MKKLLLIFGTRPEAIKMAPLFLGLKKRQEFKVEVCVTAQHREMLDQVLNLFSIVPRWDLNLMKREQDLTYTTTTTLSKLRPILTTYTPDLVLVHGDTTTTLAASLAAYYQKIPVGHVEAGLRTGDRYRPFPEEMNRKLCDSLSTLHFAPTSVAKQNLVQEGIPRKGIFVTGNTVIDALQLIVQREVPLPPLLKKIQQNLQGRKLVVATAHRRESFGKPMKEIARAIQQLARRNRDLLVVFSVHRNPEVRRCIQRFSHEQVWQVDPLPYLEFAKLMSWSTFLLTDSGGLQEEGPALHKPVLVMREVTERPEALQAGTAKLVGLRARTILQQAEQLLRKPAELKKMKRAKNPYGDGKACLRIARGLLYFFRMQKSKPREFRDD